MLWGKTLVNLSSYFQTLMGLDTEVPFGEKAPNC